MRRRGRLQHSPCKHTAARRCQYLQLHKLPRRKVHGKHMHQTARLRTGPAPNVGGWSLIRRRYQRNQHLGRVCRPFGRNGLGEPVRVQELPRRLVWRGRRQNVREMPSRNVPRRDGEAGLQNVRCWRKYCSRRRCD